MAAAFAARQRPVQTRRRPSRAGLGNTTSNRPGAQLPTTTATASPVTKVCDSSSTPPDTAYADLLSGNLDVLDTIPPSALTVYQRDLGDHATSGPAAIT